MGQVGEVTYDLSKARTTMEQEEIEMEQREKQQRLKYSRAFETFFKKVHIAYLLINMHFICLQVYKSYIHILSFTRIALSAVDSDPH